MSRRFVGIIWRFNGAAFFALLAMCSTGEVMAVLFGVVAFAFVAAALMRMDPLLYPEEGE